MKLTQLVVIPLLAAGLFSGCFRNDRRIGEFHVAQMQSQECLTYLSAKLRAMEGVEDVEADFSTQTVRVTFNGLKLALKNIELNIADAGFDVDTTPGNPGARTNMPASCLSP